MLAGAALAYEPHRVAFYLQETIAAFHSWYTQGKRTGERVIGRDPLKTAGRLFLCRALSRCSRTASRSWASRPRSGWRVRKLAISPTTSRIRRSRGTAPARREARRAAAAVGGVMRDENVRVREKFELSLDGRQIASIVVGALVILGVVFVLGLNVGRQIAARQVEAARGGDLDGARSRAGAAPAAPAKGDITFYDQLPKEKPAPPPPEPARPRPGRAGAVRPPRAVAAAAAAAADAAPAGRR